jgi:hypothetical protein
MTVSVLLLALAAVPEAEAARPFSELLATPVALKHELEGVHPRVFVTSEGLEALRRRARTTHKDEWQRVLAALPALKGDPPPPPGPQARRAQNDVALAIAGVSLAYAVERKPEYLQAARRWTLAAAQYEPWGYTFNKPNVDLAAGHLLYAIGWAYDLLYADLSPDERAAIRTSLERHAALVYEHFAPRPGRRFQFTQNHDFIPTSGLAVAALALMGESKDAPRWAALARAHLDRTLHLLSPDGYYYEGFEYWIFAAPWLVHFLDAWEHATGESLWDAAPLLGWKSYVAHTVLPDGQKVFDFGDVWEGPLTRDGRGGDYARVYPGGRLQSNYNLLYRVAARRNDPATQAVAERLAGFGHSNLEEYWTLLWRDPELRAAPMSAIPLTCHFEDSGVVFHRTSWDEGATAVALRAGPPEGHRAAALLPRIPEWEMESGHAHPDAGSFIWYAGGRYVTGDTGYAGLPAAAHHNTIVVDGVGQGREGKHNVWDEVSYARLDGIRILAADAGTDGLRVIADATAAYPGESGLNEFKRELVLDSPSSLTVVDHIRTDRPRPVDWYLHADRAFVAKDGGFHVDLGGGVSLEAAVEARGRAVKTITGSTIVTSPGRPGSIEAGPKEERGYELRVQTAPAEAIEIRARLEVKH